MFYLIERSFPLELLHSIDIKWFDKAYMPAITWFENREMLNSFLEYLNVSYIYSSIAYNLPFRWHLVIIV